jgi:hypothetical protein
VSDETIQQFVLGLADVTALEPLGIEVAFERGGMTMRDRSTQEVRPSIAELATGYVASWAQGSEVLQRWAQVILGLTAVDLSALEDAPEGEALLEAIWDASAGTPKGIDVATRLADG